MSRITLKNLFILIDEGQLPQVIRNLRAKIMLHAVIAAW